MLRRFLQRWVRKFEREWSYDASYMHELIDIDPRAMLAFGKVQGLAKYQKDIPLAPWAAAAIVAVMSEDCGPCTQLTIDMAERGGVDPSLLRAVVARDYAAIPYDVALAARFTEATLRHAPEADDLREEVMRQFGRRGLVSLAFAMLAARMYPTLKYAMGHGKACTRLKIGGETRPVLREMTRAA